MKKIILTSLSRYSSTVASFLMIVMAARYLGPSGKGIYNTMQAYGGAAGLLATLSISGTIFRSSQADSRTLEELAGGFLAMFAIMSALTCLALGAWYLLMPDAFTGISPLLFIPLALIAVFFVAEDYSNYLVTYLNRIEVYNYAMLAFAGTILLVSAFGFWAGWGIWAAVAGFLCGKAAHISICLIEIAKRCNGLKIRLKNLSLLAKDGIRLHINIVGTVLMNHLNIVLLNLYTSTADIGIYQLAFQLNNLFLVVTRSANMMFLGRARSESPDLFWQKQNKYILLILGVMSVLSVFAWFLSPYAIPLVFGESFTASAGVFQILLLTLPGMVMSDLMTSQWFSRGYFLRFSLIRLLIGGLNCGLNVYFIPLYGLDGLLAVNIVIYSILFAVNIIFQLILNRTVNKLA